MTEDPAEIKKVILCNRSALERKYGRYAEEIEETMDFIIRMDEEKGISSCLIMLDNAKQMQLYRGAAVKDCLSREQNKKAVDAIVKFYRPDLITIWGGPDIIPHQAVKSSEDEEDISTDLPYACDSGYGTKLSSFKKPRRKVTRLPDAASEEDGTLTKQSESANELRRMLVQFSQFSGREKAYFEYWSDIEAQFPPGKNKVRLNRETLVINPGSNGARLVNNRGTKAPPAAVCLFNGAAAYLSVTGVAAQNEYDSRLLTCFKKEINSGQMLGAAFLAALDSIAADAMEHEAAAKVMARWMLMGDSSFRPVKKS